MKYILILLLIISCGTRKTFQQKESFKTDSIYIDNSVILKQNISWSDSFIIKPIDLKKPIVINGKSYDNSIIEIRSDKKEDNELIKKNIKASKKVSTQSKKKETQKTDYTILYLGLFFILCLFIFLWFKFKS